MNGKPRFAIAIATLIAMTPMVIGCLMIWEAVTRYRERASYESKRQTTQGEVIAIEMRQVGNRKSPHMNPFLLYRFTTASGLVRTGSNQGRVPVGSRFPVVYDPSNPKSADIASYFEEKLPDFRLSCYMVIPLGVLLFGLGSFFLYCIHR